MEKSILMCYFTVQIPYTERTETAFFCKRFNNQKDLQLRKPGGLEIRKRENSTLLFLFNKTMGYTGCTLG